MRIEKKFCDAARTDDDAFGWKKKKVPEIKEELKRLGLGAHGKKAELIARLENHISTELSQAEPSNAKPNNSWLMFVLADEDTRTWRNK